MKTRKTFDLNDKEQKNKFGLSKPVVKNEDLEGYMIGGKNAEKEQFPYQVSLRIEYNDDHFCGGTIITKYHVVSAAHCFCKGNNKKSADQILVAAGLINLESIYVKILEVDRVICYPQFDNNTMEHDIAMLKVKKPFQWSKRIQPIKIWIEGTGNNYPVKGNLPVIVTGWGSQDFNGEATMQLQYINTFTISLKECYTKLKNAENGLEKYLRSYNLCTFNSDLQRTCTGDSGGPVVFQNSLLAVVSWSKRCDERVPGVHTVISQHYKWMLKECNKDLKSI